eukprot:CAMPEP_0114432728 /NCGR_PEP_ID=MMETSP0103-20121206/11313_1 /TAXON_ID=37642 ORGANISM="Paraphysomonas imperforata, Strain PA2" /NCGR_SAMPLE_ID=MMETSP0103 /ASSEMBLY_ACC=CAM_ASM_000201 /LENGTH=899 /DNA_ID=CAMNT_0001602429 /DNA_START=163 /DNA_END=2862 /DNA_ORIENTATION=-
MGQSQSLKNLDKRTARREYRADFSRAIDTFRDQIEQSRHLPCLQPNTSRDYIEDESAWQDKIQVNIRKRPLSDAEFQNSEFDVISCVTSQTIMVHDARLDSDMKTQLLRHHEFSFHQVFSESATNDDVYRETVLPMVSLVQGGADGTIFMYGQTGSGKTYTMTSIYRRLAMTLFPASQPSRGHGARGVRVSYIEISGDKCRDLLNHGNAVTLLKCNHKLRTAVASATSEDTEYFEAYPAVEPVVHNMEEFISLIRYGAEARSTAATGVHDASSRSHAVLKVFIDSPRHYDSYDHHNINKTGALTLIDLAGSEHRVDSMYHSKARQQESVEINSSLMALKMCLRSRGRPGTAALYRKSKLTMMLKNSLVSPSSRTAVIVTVSPASKDTEHSLNSLRHACLMDGQDTTKGGRETRFMSGGLSTTVRIGEVNLTAQARERKARAKQGLGAESLKTCNGNTGAVNSSTFGDGHEMGLEDGDRLQPSRRVSMHKLDSRLRTELTRCRSNLGLEKRQLCRLGAVPVQVLIKALGKAGVSPERSRRIVDENIDRINSSTKMSQKCPRAPTRRSTKKESHCADGNSSQSGNSTVPTSIAVAILDLHPPSADRNLHQDVDKVKFNSCLTMHVSELAEGTGASASENPRRTHGSVTRENIQPVVFSRLPSSSASSHDCYTSTILDQECNSPMLREGPDICAESICSENLSRRRSTGGSVRVNKSAALRQQHSAQKTKRLEGAKKSRQKKQLHKHAWSSAGVSHVPDSWVSDNAEHEAAVENSDRCSRRSSLSDRKTGKYRAGDAWAHVQDGIEARHSTGGMFFEVTGCDDFQAAPNVPKSREYRDEARGGSSDSSEGLPFRSLNCQEDEPLRRPGSQGCHGQGGRVAVAGSSWSVDLARSRYGQGWEYD